MKFANLLSYPALKKKVKSGRLVEPLSLDHKRIAIVGEALGADEVAQEEYFVGKAGRLLDKLLREAGLDRSLCHITNVVKVQPPGNKIKRLGELELSLEAFLPLLKEELNEVKPTVIIPLGNVALEALTGQTGITKWRGSELTSSLLPGVRTFPTLHPSYVQRGSWGMYPFVRRDLEQAAKASLGILQKARGYTAIIDPTLDESLEYLSECERSETVVLDIETAHRKIRAVGFSKSPTCGISIPLRVKNLRNRWNYIELCILLSAIRRVYDSPCTKVAHNAEYDFLWLYPLVGLPMPQWFDTMRAHALVYPESAHTLGFVMSTHTKMPYHKDEGRGATNDEELWHYNIKDCVGTYRVYQRLESELREIDMWNFFTGYTMPFLRLTLEMERVGIRVDKAKFEKKKVLVQRKATALEGAITRKVGRSINVNSPKQVGELLYDDWKLPRQRHRKTGRETADRTALEFLYARYPNPVFKMILVQRHLTAKILGTYLSDKIIAEDGHAHTSFGVTVTGRLSSRESDVFNSGTDLQNQPKKIRDMFVPDVGHVFTSVDATNAENRVQALVANMRRALAAFERGENVHLKVGEWIHGRVIDKKQEPDEYKRLKNVQHGTNYGMGSKTFATYVKKSAAEAKVLQGRYLEWVPELRKWHGWVELKVTTGDRTLTTPLGRRRTFTKPPSDHKLQTEAFAHIPQSTVADIVNLGGLGLWLCLPNDCRMVLQIHDEWLISHPEDKAEVVRELATTHLQDLREIEWDDRRLTIPVEFEACKKTWRG